VLKTLRDSAFLAAAVRELRADLYRVFQDFTKINPDSPSRSQELEWKRHRIPQLPNCSHLKIQMSVVSWRHDGTHVPSWLGSVPFMEALYWAASCPSLNGLALHGLNLQTIGILSDSRLKKIMQLPSVDVQVPRSLVDYTFEQFELTPPEWEKVWEFLPPAKILVLGNCDTVRTIVHLSDHCTDRLRHDLRSLEFHPRKPRRPKANSLRDWPTGFPNLERLCVPLICIQTVFSEAWPSLHMLELAANYAISTLHEILEQNQCPHLKKLTIWMSYNTLPWDEPDDSNWPASQSQISEVCSRLDIELSTPLDPSTRVA
jgi:hypothetical protein